MTDISASKDSLFPKKEDHPSQGVQWPWSIVAKLELFPLNTIHTRSTELDAVSSLKESQVQTI